MAVFRYNRIMPIGIVCIVVILYIVYVHTMTSMVKPRNASIKPVVLVEISEPKTKIKEVQVPVKDQTDMIYQRRWDRYMKVCAIPHNNRTQSKDAELLYAEKFRLACKITPKAGSTTLIAIFKMLNEYSDENVFMKSRMKMHVQSENTNIKKKFKINELGNTVVVLPTRDPYSRIFSAFVDKIYLADDLELTEAVTEHAGGSVDQSHWWKQNITFQMFLDYVSDRSLLSYVQGNHFDQLFRPKFCYLKNPAIIIKQEHFSTDIEYVLRSVQIKQDDLKVIQKVLNSSRAETTVASTVKTALEKLKNHFNEMGQFRSTTRRWEALQFLYKRLWSSFQIQGLISINSVFPITKFRSHNSLNDIGIIVNTFLSEIKDNPLTSMEQKEQRQTAMLEAYRHVDMSSIKALQTIYKTDFKAFQYNSVLPL